MRHTGYVLPDWPRHLVAVEYDGEWDLEDRAETLTLGITDRVRAEEP